MLKTYHLTPEQINDLTLYQLAYLLGGIVGESGRVTMTREQAQNVKQQKQKLEKLGLI